MANILDRGIVIDTKKAILGQPHVKPGFDIIKGKLLNHSLNVLKRKGVDQVTINAGISWKGSL